MADRSADQPKIPSRAALARRWPQLRVNRYSGKWRDDATGRRGDDLASLASYLSERETTQKPKSKARAEHGNIARDVESRDKSENISIFRSPKVVGKFTTVPNELARDLILSCDARSIMLDLLSRPDNWSICVEKIARDHGICRERAQRAFRQLREHGYARLENLIDPATGRRLGKRWGISDRPDDRQDDENHPSSCSGLTKSTLK